MEDAIGKIIAGVLLGLGIIFLPILGIAVKNENTIQAGVENAVVEFVDNARSTGKITSADYENLCYTIDMFQNFCNVQIKHSSDMIYPGTDPSGYEHFYADYNKDDILNVIYETSSTENVPYRMRNGDYLTVTVYNTQPTLATMLYRFIMPLYNPNNTSIYVNYGGMVGNNVE